MVTLRQTNTSAEAGQSAVAIERHSVNVFIMMASLL